MLNSGTPGEIEKLKNQMYQIETDNLEFIRKGDKAAFEKIFRDFYEKLCSFANSYVFDINEAQDIVQDLFFHIWVNREKFPKEISLKAYLFTSVKNRCLNVLKHRKILRKHSESVLSEQSPNRYDVEFPEPDELHEKIRKTIELLPPERRKILIMSKFDGFKYREIAEKLNISVKTVENQMGKALQFLRDQLKDELSVLLFLYGMMTLLKYFNL